MRAFLLALLVAGCVQLPPSPADIQAKKFEAVPDKAVIYFVRPPVDSEHPGVVTIDGSIQVSTFQGTFNRVEVAPGPHLIEGVIPPSLRMTLDVQAGQIYFLRLWVRGTSRGGPTTASMQLVNPEQGRILVTQGSLYP
jgi:hypothetical protein